MEAHPLRIKGSPCSIHPDVGPIRKSQLVIANIHMFIDLFHSFFHNPLYSPRIPDDFRSVSACVLACVCVCTWALVPHVYSDAKSTSSVGLISSFLA